MEVELKYRATDPTVLARLASAATLGPAALGEPRAWEEVDRYLDTADGRLARAGWACRLRTRDGATLLSLKGPPAAPMRDDPAALHRRPEVEGRGNDALDAAAQPPSRARAALVRLAGGAPLVEQLTLRQARTERSVTVAGTPAGTLSLDRALVEHDGRVRGELLVVELELAADGDHARWLSPLSGALDGQPGLAPERATKLERALAMVRG